MEKELIDAADDLLTACRVRGWTVATAESCTGGMVAAALTAIAGSSDVMDRGFVTYTNEAKNEMIGVPMDLFETVGAVSEDVAKAMAEGAMKTANVDLACGITGVAGPGGGSKEKASRSRAHRGGIESQDDTRNAASSTVTVMRSGSLPRSRRWRC